MSSYFGGDYDPPPGSGRTGRALRLAGLLTLLLVGVLLACLFGCGLLGLLPGQGAW